MVPSPKSNDKPAEQDDSAEATPELNEWKAALPERTSAAAADGKHPILAFPIMLLGVAVTAACGVLAVGIVIAVLAISIGCGQVSPVPINIPKLLVMMGCVGDAIILVTLTLLGLAAVSVASALVLPVFVRLARNRSEDSVFPYALAASFIAAVAAKTTVVLIFEDPAPSVQQIGVIAAVRWAWGVTTADRIITTIWVSLTSLIGATVAWAAASDLRWCYACGGRAMRVMQEVGLKYGLLRNLVIACNDHDPKKAAEIAAQRTSGPVGRAGRVYLYRCMKCERGLLEAKATFEKDNQSRSWLVASVALSPEEAAVVDPILAKGPSPERRKKKHQDRRQRKP